MYNLIVKDAVFKRVYETFIVKSLKIELRYKWKRSSYIYLIIKEGSNGSCHVWDDDDRNIWQWHPPELRPGSEKVKAVRFPESCINLGRFIILTWRWNVRVPKTWCARILVNELRIDSNGHNGYDGKKSMRPQQSPCKPESLEKDKIVSSVQLQYEHFVWNVGSGSSQCCDPGYNCSTSWRHIQLTSSLPATARISPGLLPCVAEHWWPAPASSCPLNVSEIRWIWCLRRKFHKIVSFVVSKVCSAVLCVSEHFMVL